MRSIEALVLERIEGVFARCPELFRFSVRDRTGLPDHIDALYRAAWAMCGSPLDAEDLVQTTFEQVLKRRRIIRSDQPLLPFNNVTTPQ